MEIYYACFRKNSKPLLWRFSFIRFIVVVWTVRLIAIVSMLTYVQLEKIWMIFLFFPSMTLWAFLFILTAFSVFIYLFLRTPISTLFFCVEAKLRLPSVILPVVSKHTHFSSMISFIVRTPNSLEMEHIKVDVSFK